MIQNKAIFNLWGVPVNIGAISFNVSEFINSVHINKFLTLIISVLAIIWWFMKIYDQYITTRRHKIQLNERRVESLNQNKSAS